MNAVLLFEDHRHAFTTFPSPSVSGLAILERTSVRCKTRGVCRSLAPHVGSASPSRFSPLVARRNKVQALGDENADIIKRSLRRRTIFPRPDVRGFLLLPDGPGQHLL